MGQPHHTGPMTDQERAERRARGEYIPETRMEIVAVDIRRHFLRWQLKQIDKQDH